jgi:UDPglucose--hexose-1-phosphate uridylyltransferase
MNVLRFDHTTADWVVYAPLRKLRPHHDKTSLTRGPDALRDTKEFCPFCPGNERMTPPEIYAVRADGSGRPSDWKVRVIPNKFPALRIEENHKRHEEDGATFQWMGGCGAHEVVIESSDHTFYLGKNPVEQIALVLQTLLVRYLDLKRDKRFQSVIIFKNHGEGAGTSIRHPHCQIIATPVVPRLLRLKCNVATEYFDRTGNCLYRVMVEDELKTKLRLIATNDEFVAFIPYAAHLPFETWILPRRAQASWESLQTSQIHPLAEILKTVILKLYDALDDPDFNLAIDMAPRGDEEMEYFLWHIRVLPRTSTPAGFEMGSGMSISTTMPEEAAAFLRDGDVG